jgi:hypothetical protein
MNDMIDFRLLATLLSAAAIIWLAARFHSALWALLKCILVLAFLFGVGALIRPWLSPETLPPVIALVAIAFLIWDFFFGSKQNEKS